MLEIGKEKKIKKLVKGLVKTGGRNEKGRITVFHRGGGHKQLYRIIDQKREMLGIPGKIKQIEYDPNRTGKIALVLYSNGYLSYILATAGMKKGDIVVSNSKEVNWDFNKYGISKNGSVFLLKECKVGDIVSSIEIRPGSGGVFMKAAGTYGEIKKKDAEGNYVIIKLSSGEERLFSGDCKAVQGRVSNDEHMYKRLRKAGENRWLGKRPVVRGIAMNPVDHPHGGRTNGGRPCVSPWGKLTKGKPTRKVRKNSKFIIKKSK